VFLNRLGGLILSACLMSYFKIQWVQSPLWEYSFPSVANMLSSWCQYKALEYVTFPTQMLAKAFKILPGLEKGLGLGLVDLKLGFWLKPESGLGAEKGSE
jgi:adenosine 3'-phospho 5'-phosphosulfate transporter B2